MSGAWRQCPCVEHCAPYVRSLADFCQIRLRWVWQERQLLPGGAFSVGSFCCVGGLDWHIDCL